jgi:bifunctional non-homologous end joining protein LigD
MESLPLIQPVLPVGRLHFPTGEGWIYELKYDGYRGVLYLEKGEATILTKSGKRNLMFRSLESRLAQCLAGPNKKRNMILDGEVCALDEKGKSIRGDIGAKRASLVYVAFDIMWLDGRDLRQLPLSERKKILKKLLDKGTWQCVLFASHLTDGVTFFRLVHQYGLEGIVAKRLTDPYSRSTLWIKLKNPHYVLPLSSKKRTKLSTPRRA